MGSLSIWHWIVVIAVVLLLFGRGKISDLMGDVAQGIKAFKKGMQDDDKRRKARAGEVDRSQCGAGADGGAVGCRQQGRLNQASGTGRRLKDAVEKRRGQPQILRDRDWGADVSRERKISCSTSGGVNWSSSRSSR